MSALTPGLSTIGNVPEGMQPFVLARLVERALSEGDTDRRRWSLSPATGGACSGSLTCCRL